MTTRRSIPVTAPAAGALLGFGSTALTVPVGACAQDNVATGPIWRSPSLREETVTARTGAFPGYAPNANVIIGVTSWGVPYGTELFAGASLFTASNIISLINTACSAYPLACS